MNLHGLSVRSWGSGFSPCKNFIRARSLQNRLSWRRVGRGDPQTCLSLSFESVLVFCYLSTFRACAGFKGPGDPHHPTPPNGTPLGQHLLLANVFGRCGLFVRVPFLDCSCSSSLIQTSSSCSSVSCSGVVARSLSICMQFCRKCQHHNLCVAKAKDWF